MADTQEKLGLGIDSTLDEAAARMQRRTLATFLAWIGSFMAVTFVLGDEYLALEFAGAHALALLPSVVGAVAIYMYWRFLRSCDDLQQRIQLNGLALGFGAGLVFMMGYRLLERVGAPSLDVNDSAGLMAACYALGALLSARSYR